MALSRTWLLGVARHERDALGRTVQYADPARWDEPSPAEGWTAKDVLAHLDATEAAAAQTLAGEAKAAFDEFVKESGAHRLTVPGFHDFNAWAVKRRADAAVVALAIGWGRSADRLLAEAGRLTDARWTETVPWPVEDIRIAYFLQSRVCEWWVHGEDVRTAVGLPSRRIHDPIFCVADLSIRTLPYALQQEGLSFPGRSVQIDLEGAGEGSWHQGLSPRDRPAEDKIPDAYIDGRADAFARVAAHRADPEALLYEGVLQVGGDADLARTVLEHIRYFA